MKKADIKHLAAAVITLTSCAIGAGLVSLPFAFQHGGLVACSILLLFTAALNLVSLFLVALAADMTKAKSYGELALVYGRKWRVAMEGVLAIVLLGVAISLQIIITDTFKQIIDTVSDMPASKRDHIALGCVAGLDVLVIMPLAALRNITWLSASGGLSVTSFLYLVFWLIIQGEKNIENHHTSEKSRHHTTEFSFWNLIDIAPIIVYSLGCQVQAVALYREMPIHLRHPVRFVKLVSTPAIILCLVLYISAGSLGMFAIDQQKEISGDVLSDLPTNLISASIVQFAVGISLVTVSPVIIWPIRESIMEIIEAFRSRGDSAENDDQDSGDNTPILTDSEPDLPYGFEHIKSSPLLRPSAEAGSAMAVTASLRDENPERFLRRLLKESATARVAFSLVIVGVAYGVSVLVPNVTIVFRFVGAVGASFLFYIYPSAIVMRMQYLNSRSSEETTRLIEDFTKGEKDSHESLNNSVNSIGMEPHNNSSYEDSPDVAARRRPQTNGDPGKNSLHEFDGTVDSEEEKHALRLRRLRSSTVFAACVCVLLLGVVISGLSTYSVITS